MSSYFSPRSSVSRVHSNTSFSAGCGLLSLGSHWVSICSNTQQNREGTAHHMVLLVSAHMVTLTSEQSQSLLQWSGPLPSHHLLVTTKILLIPKQSKELSASIQS